MQIFNWYKPLSEDREVAENLPHTTRPYSTIKNDDFEKMEKIVFEDCRIYNIIEIALTLNISSVLTR